MKKILLVSFMVLFSSVVMAQKKVEQVKKTDVSEDDEALEELFSALDMKIFHDRQIMQEVVMRLYEQQTTGGEARENMTLGIFNEEDSNIIEKAMDNTQLKYKVDPELMKKAQEAPFEAFKDLVKNADVPKLTKEELSELETVDRKAIPELLEMATESGPDIGARRVSVMYNETQN